MRTTILPSMLEILTRNYNYRNKAVRLYELGKIYLPREDGLADEPKILSLGAYGDGMDFFTLKGGIEAILRACRIKDVRFEACRGPTPPITPAAAQRSMPAMSSWVCSARSTRSSRPTTAWTREIYCR